MVFVLATVTVGIAAAFLCVTIAAVVLIAWALNAIDLAEDEDGDGNDDGGLGVRRPDDGGGPPAGGDPAWWPAFEAELAEYEHWYGSRKRRHDDRLSAR